MHLEGVVFGFEHRLVCLWLAVATQLAVVGRFPLGPCIGCGLGPPLSLPGVPQGRAVSGAPGVCFRAPGAGTVPECVPAAAVGGVHGGAAAGPGARLLQVHTQQAGQDRHRRLLRSHLAGETRRGGRAAGS